MFEAPQRKRGLDQKPVSKVVPLVMLLVVVLVGAAIQHWVATREQGPALIEGAPPTVDVSDLVPATWVDQANEGWTISVTADWPGRSDPAIASKACAELTKRLSRTTTTALDIVNEEGVTIIRCP